MLLRYESEGQKGQLASTVSRLYHVIRPLPYAQNLSCSLLRNASRCRHKLRFYMDLSDPTWMGLIMTMLKKYQ